MDGLKPILTKNNEQIDARIMALRGRVQELKDEIEKVRNEISELSGRRNQNADILKFMEEQEGQEEEFTPEVINANNTPTEADSEE